LHNIDTMRYDGGMHFPVVIEMRTVEHPCEQVQTTLASIERGVERARNGVGMLVLKPLKQKLIADGVVYLLQEIFGIENKDTCDADEENGAECIICMCDLRDTVILPCRHLCICSGCAENLKYKLNNCPICRSPFRALLQLKAMRALSTVSVTDQASAQSMSQTRYETLTLIEALNGPMNHVTTIGASGNLRGSLRISPRAAVSRMAAAEAGQLSRSASSRRSTTSRREILTVEPTAVVRDVTDNGMVAVDLDKKEPRMLPLRSTSSDNDSALGSGRSAEGSKLTHGGGEATRRQLRQTASDDTDSNDEYHICNEQQVDEDDSGCQPTMPLDTVEVVMHRASVTSEMRPPDYRPPPPPCDV